MIPPSAEFIAAISAIPVRIKRMHPDAVIPQYAHTADSGFDLVAVEDVIVRPGETAKVPVGLAFEIPQGYELQVRPRSGVTMKTKLRVVLGTVDAGYRGEVAVIIDGCAFADGGALVQHYKTLYAGEVVLSSEVTNHFGKTHHEWVYENTYLIRKGDKIAQGVIAPVIHATFTEADELCDSDRGAGGFGSSGTAVGEVSK